MDLQQAYSRQNRQTWLKDILGSQIQFEAQTETIDIDRENIKSVQRFAFVDNEKNIADKVLKIVKIDTREIIYSK